MEKTNIKRIVTIISLVIMISSINFDFLILDGISIRSYSVNGFMIVLTSLIFLIYSISIKKKILYYISATVGIIGYMYTFYSLVNGLIINNDAKIPFAFDWGFYFYLASFIILIISFFILDKRNKKLKEDNESQQFKSDVCNVNKDLILLGNFVLGFKEIPYNEIVLLVNNIEESLLSLQYKINDEILEIKIPYSTIMNLEFNTELVLNNNQQITQSSETANLLLSAALFAGNPIAMMGTSNLLNSLQEDYNKPSIKYVFKLIIDLKYNGDDKRIIIITKKKPDKFVTSIKNKNN